MNNNARYDRPTDTFELEVNVPRTIGILRDGLFFHIFHVPSLLVRTGYEPLLLAGT